MSGEEKRKQRGHCVGNLEKGGKRNEKETIISVEEMAGKC